MENIEVVNMELLDFGLPQKKKRNSNAEWRKYQNPNHR